MIDDDIPTLINDLPVKQKVFALNVARGESQSEAARMAGYTGHVDIQGSKMAKDPDIAAAIDELKKYNAGLITDDLIREGLLREAITADASRDRTNALALLAKTRGLLHDTVDHSVRTRGEPDILAEIEKEFGPEARIAAERKLGHG